MNRFYSTAAAFLFASVLVTGDAFAQGDSPYVMPTPARKTIKLAGDKAKEIPQGPYQPTWESVKENYQTPEWVMDDKFGIFIHYGAYTVAAHASEWYPKHMYNNGDVKKWHEAKFGKVTEVGYKDLIPMFKMEKFNASEWADLFKKAGARYVVPTAEHHDGFAMYDSKLTKWNAKNMGPHIDFIGELGKAVRKDGLKFGISNHRIENWDFMYPSIKAPTDLFDPAYADFYGPPQPPRPSGPPAQPAKDEVITNYNGRPSQAFQEEWLARMQEIVDNYKPDMVFFDNGINPRYFDPVKLRFAAYYYNSALKWKKPVTITTKADAYLYGTVTDYERQGRAPKELTKHYWQVDDPIGEKFGYVEGMKLTTAANIVNSLVNNVSRNGNYMLNISPRSDGTIPEEQKQILLAVGRWMDQSGEAIYATRAWKTYGEDSPADAQPHQPNYKFTTKGNTLYVISQGWPQGQALIRTLADGGTAGKVTRVTLLGQKGDLKFTQDKDGLRIDMPVEKKGEFAWAFKIEGLTLK